MLNKKLNNIIILLQTLWILLIMKIPFLEIVRPGGERLVDQLMISEELRGKDLTYNCS
jgi:hypothetical protein